MRNRSLLWVMTGWVVMLSTLIVTRSISAQETNTNQAQIADLEKQRDAAMDAVRRIVNQPVKRYIIGGDVNMGESIGGWFHPGAGQPDFDNVDIRKTQEFPYEKYDYITSDLNPGIMFATRQLEFNANIKMFYMDRSVPKKRLTEPEMVEINRLYRIIGRCQRELDALQHPPVADTVAAQQEDAPDPPPLPWFRRIPRENFIRGGLAILAILVLYTVSKMVSRKRARS